MGIFMSKIAVKTSSYSGHGKFPSRPLKLWTLLRSTASVYIGVLVQGDAYTSHSDGKTSHEGTALSTRPWITINGMPVVCEGDPVFCGSTATSGDQLVMWSTKTGHRFRVFQVSAFRFVWG